LNSYGCASTIEEEQALREITQEIVLAALGRTSFFDKAAFQGGTCLRIFHGVNRFSEDLDFALRKPDRMFELGEYLKCVERSSSEWVLVLDSDNTAFSSYLDALGGIRNPDPQIFYCASWAWPFFPFQDFSGLRMDFESACEWTRSGLLKRVYIFNDGNYLVNRKSYTEAVGGMGMITSDVADVMVVNYQWLSKGGSLEVLPGVPYFHRVDASSFWNRTAEESKKRVTEIYSFLEAERRMEEGMFTAK
jgi:hypothetical protein